MSGSRRRQYVVANAPSHYHIDDAARHEVSSAAGALYGMVVYGGASGGTITVSDGSQTISIITLAADAQTHLDFYGLRLANGLVVTQSAADMDCTVVYD